MDTYDQWKLSSNSEKERVFCKCENCRQDIYVDEEYLEINGYDIHEDCFEEFARIILSPIRRVGGEES